MGEERRRVDIVTDSEQNAVDERLIIFGYRMKLFIRNLGSWHFVTYKCPEMSCLEHCSQISLSWFAQDLLML